MAKVSQAVAEYAAWYQSAKGSWIAGREFSILQKLFTPSAGQSLLDVGCGSGYFSEQFSHKGLVVTGLDSDARMLDYASRHKGEVRYLEGNAEALSFVDNSFDYCSAITSLCFVERPQHALSEMQRVARKGIILGLLNRHSLLYYRKHDHGGYRGARWDTVSDVKKWISELSSIKSISYRSCIWTGSADKLSQMIETLLPSGLALGGFLAIYLQLEK